jgi:hypothetical protein
VTPADGTVTRLYRTEALAALPALLDLARQAVMATFGPDDAESGELKTLLDACVVGAHRLRLREQLRSEEAGDCP